MSVTRFSHVTIYCADLDASLDFYRDVLEMSISDRKLPKGFPRAAIGCFVDGEWCLHFFEATAEQRAQFETLPERRTGVLMHVSLRAEGYVATIVNGTVVYRDGQPTGALPGRLVRGQQAAPAL